MTHPARRLAVGNPCSKVPSSDSSPKDKSLLPQYGWGKSPPLHVSSTGHAQSHGKELIVWTTVKISRRPDYRSPQLILNKSDHRSDQLKVMRILGLACDLSSITKNGKSLNNANKILKPSKYEDFPSIIVEPITSEIHYRQDSDANIEDAEDQLRQPVESLDTIILDKIFSLKQINPDGRRIQTELQGCQSK